MPKSMTTEALIDVLGRNTSEHIVLASIDELLAELQSRAHRGDKLAKAHVYAIDVQHELSNCIVEIIRQTYAKRGTPIACPAVTAAAIANAIEMLGDTYIPQIHDELDRVRLLLAQLPRIQEERAAAFVRFNERQALADRLLSEGRPASEVQEAVFKMIQLQNAKMELPAA